MVLLSTNLSQKYKCQLRLFPCLLPCPTYNHQVCFSPSFSLSHSSATSSSSTSTSSTFFSFHFCLYYHYSYSYYQVLRGLTFVDKEARFHMGTPGIRFRQAAVSREPVTGRRSLQKEQPLIPSPLSSSLSLSLFIAVVPRIMPITRRESICFVE